MTITPCVLVCMVNIVSTGRVPILANWFCSGDEFWSIKYCIPWSIITSSQLDHVACSLNSKTSYTDFERTLATATLFCIVAISCPMSQLASTLIKFLVKWPQVHGYCSFTVHWTGWYYDPNHSYHLPTPSQFHLSSKELAQTFVSKPTCISSWVIPVQNYIIASRWMHINCSKQVSQLALWSLMNWNFYVYGKCLKLPLTIHKYEPHL